MKNLNLYWYSVQVYNTCELSVQSKIEKLKEDHNIEEIEEIFAPYENVISISEIKKEKRILKKSIYPGYIFLGLTKPLSKALILKLKNLDKLSQVIPVQLKDNDLAKIMKKTKSLDPNAVKYKNNYDKNDKVVVVNGPFCDFKGEIEHIDQEQQEAVVRLQILGRATNVSVKLSDIQLNKEDY